MSEQKMKRVLLEASGCHVHLTTQAVETLFGKGAVLKKRRDLSQPGEFLSEQRVKLVTRHGVIENVAVLGPARDAVQVELSLTDCRKLGIKAPVNLSGDLTDAADVLLVGDVGELKAAGSVIVARNHIHMTTEDAREFGVANGDKVCVLVKSDRNVIFEDVPVRVKDSYALAMHIDFDEANACGYKAGTEAFVLYDECACGQANSIQKPSIDKEDLIRAVVSEVMRTLVGSGCLSNRRSSADTATVSPAESEACICPNSCAMPVQEKLITEVMAREIVRACAGNEISVVKGTIITPAAKDIFKSAKKNVVVL